jgi:glycerol kinase
MDRTFEPRMSADEAAHRRSRWAEALRRSRDWEERSSEPALPGADLTSLS